MVRWSFRTLIHHFRLKLELKPVSLPPTTQKQAAREASRQPVYGIVLSLTIKIAEFKHGEASLTVNSNKWEIVAAHSCSIPSLSSNLCITVRTKLDRIKSQKEGRKWKEKKVDGKKEQTNKPKKPELDKSLEKEGVAV